MHSVNTRVAAVVLGVALLLIFGGSALAFWGQTAGGDVDVQEVTIETDNGTLNGYLYVPNDASAENPHPGILAVHGYINTKETQSPFAIEYAKRGHVVLAIDQPGHGKSDPPAYAGGFGGPAALEYLADRPAVDEENIGLEGHSMGGWSVAAAAAEHPDAYKSMVLAGSGTGIDSQGVPPGNATYPRNLAVVFAEYDEFAWLMWGAEDSRDIGDTSQIEDQFGVNETVAEGETYGSIENGTARQLVQPSTTHPGVTHSSTAVAESVEWMQRTLEGNEDTDPANQNWQWKELGTFLALLGGILAMFPVGGLLLGREQFSGVRRELPSAEGRSGRDWYLSAGLACLLPLVTYYPAMIIGSLLIPPTWLFPQAETNGIVLWALVNTLLIAGLFGVWQYRRDRSFAALRAHYGLDTGAGGGTLARSLAVAGAVVATIYALLWVVHTLFMTDFRVWVVAIRPMASHHVGIFLRYLPLLTLFFLALGVLLHGQLRTPDRSLRRSIGINVGLLSGPFVVLLVVMYLPMLTSGALLIPLTALQTIIAIQFVIILGVVAATSTYFFHLTGRIWVGSLLNGLFVTWVIVASQATHVPV